MDLNLVDPLDSIFDRILDGEDLLVRAIQCLQRRIQGGGLTGTGWPRHQEDAVWTLDQSREPFQGVVAHPQVTERNQVGLAVEQAHYTCLAMTARQQGNTYIQLTPADAMLNAAILRTPFLGDIQAAADFDVTDQGRIHIYGVFCGHLKRAIDPISNPDSIDERLDMDI